MQQFLPGPDTPENLAFAAAAIKEFLKVLELDPGNKAAMSCLASLNLYQKKWDEGQAWYEKVVAKDPRDSQALVRHGMDRMGSLLPGL